MKTDSQPVPPPTRIPNPAPGEIDNTPPRRSTVTDGLAVLACCTLPLLIAAGVLTGAGVAILEKTLFAVAAGLVTLALGMWWLHRRRSAQRATAGAGCGCGST
ncbi:hypothetical protein FHG89_14700 [Micromonospora orduensis]|uniref:Mercuric ion transport protein n=1 Tax=Micromonospora orduensis TaxID=1420891 RepID=A0A5C4QNT7_9ACTN|nr:hypothetical protein [Micromonospora orduensis]TNH28675.1 hypothetical protein FHG89_14700 [Micromonospora orduensis]